jgi:hypothetical protein
MAITLIVLVTTSCAVVSAFGFLTWRRRLARWALFGGMAVAGTFALQLLSTLLDFVR